MWFSCSSVPTSQAEIKLSAGWPSFRGCSHGPTSRLNHVGRIQLPVVVGPSPCILAGCQPPETTYIPWLDPSLQVQSPWWWSCPSPIPNPSGLPSASFFLPLLQGAGESCPPERAYRIRLGSPRKFRIASQF